MRVGVACETMTYTNASDTERCEKKIHVNGYHLGDTAGGKKPTAYRRILNKNNTRYTVMYVNETVAIYRRFSSGPLVRRARVYTHVLDRIARI